MIHSILGFLFLLVCRNSCKQRCMPKKEKRLARHRNKLWALNSRIILVLSIQAIEVKNKWLTSRVLIHTQTTRITKLSVIVLIVSLKKIEVQILCLIFYTRLNLLQGINSGYARSKTGTATNAKISDPTLYKNKVLVIPNWAKFGFSTAADAC
jgi:hypothetical protein